MLWEHLGNIWTLDIPSYDGFNLSSDFCPEYHWRYVQNEIDASGDYTGHFGGTSAACPQVAGLAALILSLNSDLEYNQSQNLHEVEQIIRLSADKPHSTVYNYNWDSQQPGHSKEMGYGRINAYEALKYTIENYGGTIGGDGKTVTFHEDITIESGVELTIASGTTVKFKPDKKLTVEGTLTAEDVTFESTSIHGEWGGLVFSGSSCSSSELEECTIEEAIVGITITGSNASPTIEKCLVQDCDSYPLKLTSDCTPNIYNNKLYAGSAHAVYISSADGDFNDNEFRTSSGSTYGVYVTGSSSNPDFDSKEGISGNLFDLSNIASHGAYAAGGYPEFGDRGPHDGLNDFINRGSSKYIYNNTGSSIDAEVNYWGGTPQSSWFSGSIDYNPYESSSNDAGPTWKIISSPFSIGSNFYEEGDYENALVELKSALEQDKESADAAGSLCFQNGQVSIKTEQISR